jgi:hypothetical protein
MKTPISLFYIFLLFSCSKSKNEIMTEQPEKFSCSVNQVYIYDNLKYRCSIPNEGNFSFGDISELKYNFSHQTDSLGILYIKFQNMSGYGKFLIKEAYVEYHPNNRYVSNNTSNIEIFKKGNIIYGSFNGEFKNHLNTTKLFSGGFEVEEKK